MPLFSWQKPAAGEEKDGEVKIKISDEDQKKIDTAAAAASELPEIKKQLESLKSIQAFVDEQRTEKDAAKAAAAAAKAKETQGQNDEELEELMLTNPREAIRRATTPQAQLLLKVAGDNLRRETFENAEKFPYYSGDIKSEVDKLIQGQSLQFQNDVSVIENAYNAVMGRHMPEILEGKLKNRFAGAEQRRVAGAAGSSGTEGEDKGRWESGNYDAETKKYLEKAAKIAGMTSDDYAKMLDKQGVGYV